MKMTCQVQQGSWDLSPALSPRSMQPFFLRLMDSQCIRELLVLTVH